MLRNRLGEEISEAELISGLTPFCYIYQCLILLDDRGEASEMLVGGTCIEEWAREYGSPGEVLPVWRAAWQKANRIRSAEPVLWGMLDEFCRSIAANFSRDNCIALLNDLVRISEADSEVSIAEAKFCTHVSRLMGLPFQFEQSASA